MCEKQLTIIHFYQQPIMDKHTTENTLYLAGVIGHPISHSKSPKLHNYWLSKYDINGFYIPFSVTTERLQSCIKSLIDLGFNGVNVTIPHKTNLISLVFSQENTDLESRVEEEIRASMSEFLPNINIVYRGLCAPTSETSCSSYFMKTDRQKPNLIFPLSLQIQDQKNPGPLQTEAQRLTM